MQWMKFFCFFLFTKRRLRLPLGFLSISPERGPLGHPVKALAKADLLGDSCTNGAQAEG